jgi:hypothetical protein
VLTEMKRTLEWFSWKIRWWRRPAERTDVVRSACHAYAEKQVFALSQLHSKFRSLWITEAKLAGLDSESIFSLINIQ